MLEDNFKTIDVSVTYNENMQFLYKSHKDLYDKIILVETELNDGSVIQKYELKFNKTYFDVYDNENSTFLYKQESNEYSQHIVSQIVNNEINNNFKPYKQILFTEEYAKNINDKKLMSSKFAATVPILDYVNQHRNDISKKMNKFIFFGVALGLHISELHKRCKCKVYLICESDLELFRLSLFTTAYSEISKTSELIFSVADTDEIFQVKCDTFLCKKYILNYNINYNLFSLRAARYIKLFQTAVTLQSFITYSYPRCFMSSTRPFKYIVKESNFLDVSSTNTRNTILSKHPVIVLASGPSLLNNIDWLVENKEKFIIISVSANLKLLSKYAIKPDVIIHIDEDKKANLKSLEGIDMEYFKESIVILSSITHPKITEKYENNTKFFIQAFANYYSDLCNLFSMSVGEVTYAFSLIFGSRNIYLLGLNYALDPLTNQSHSELHSENIRHEGLKPSHQHDDLDLYKNYLEVKGNFREKLFTTTFLYSCIAEFNFFTKVLKSDEINIFNLSDGSYLENTIPLKLDTLDMDSFVSLNKSEINKVFTQELLSNSRNKLNSYDKIIINRKIK
ncbi:MAG: motility associated factor glycosyltransferase family protein, partial [Campylobacteraceae bacterium]|nr:motility associated factor glycosyltransferase family protein [Campylobacteraceae bacterium]